MKTVRSKPPSLTDIEATVQQALKTIPEPFRRHLRDVVIRVEDFPDAETEQEMELVDPFELLGLYRGVSLQHKSTLYAHDDVDMILLYRRPILDYWCETGEDLTHIVRHVLIHEVGHHLGLSDEDMERIEGQE